MSLPASEPIPLPEEELPPARRRRLRRMVIPEHHDEQSAFLDDLGERTTPGAEFFLSALLAGLVTGIALMLDSPALVVLAALLAPFMAPVLGMGVAGVAGSTGFLLRSLVSALIGGLIFFLTGTLTGIPARLFVLNGWCSCPTSCAWMDSVCCCLAWGRCSPPSCWRAPPISVRW